MFTEQVDRIFRLSEHRTTLRQEVLAGIVTFVAIAYSILVNPAILKSAGEYGRSRWPAGRASCSALLSLCFTRNEEFLVKNPLAVHSTSAGTR